MGCMSQDVDEGKMRATFMLPLRTAVRGYNLVSIA